MAANNNQKRLPQAACSNFMVRISSGGGASIQGKIEQLNSGQVQYFQDFLAMILLVQSKLDEKGFPQCDTELRSFQGEECSFYEDGEPGKNSGEAGERDLVFLIRIKYRRNTSWQGVIQWLDGDKSCTFRSVLELGKLIYEAKITVSGDGEDSTDTIKWEDKEDVS